MEEHQLEEHSSHENEVGVPSSGWRARSDAWELLFFALKQRLSQPHGVSTQVLDAEIHRCLHLLNSLELYWARPRRSVVMEIEELVQNENFDAALAIVEPIANHMIVISLGQGAEGVEGGEESRDSAAWRENRPRFEVLIVDDISQADRIVLKADMSAHRSTSDAFAYELTIVPSFEDALIALILNPTIQAVVLRPGFVDFTKEKLSRDLRTYLDRFIGEPIDQLGPVQRILRLADKATELRPELDLYLVAGVGIEDLASTATQRFRRVFRREDLLELHLSILQSVGERYNAPFFQALQEYARRPAGVFHALPVSRGGSVINSTWIRDMGEFYGRNLLMAETSATSGGLDSLLSPSGSIKQAQTLAARAFGAKRSYFVTNGTSTANKIVHQALITPGDVVLVDRNCHKSHHYGLMMAGARVAYLDAYPLDEFSFYGAVSLRGIKQTLLDYRRAGRLDEVKMITLTNCTFDGIVYDVQRVMEECLAIKPDLIFLWDEAWFAFASFHPVYRRRTAMAAATAIDEEFHRNDYQQRFLHQQASLADADDATWLETRLIPDPEKTRIRVYATQSTHKTLTSLRQGSMIHLWDQDFTYLSHESFHDAYMTHTSTSPNYQILASLDIGRRQVELEGYELVQRQADLATSVAQAIARHTLLKKYFRVLSTRDLIPEQFRQTDKAMPLRDGLAAWDEAWRTDEFVVDPSRITLYIGLTGIDGDTFKHDYLMDQYSIQVNKTSRNTALFMTNIGTSRSAVAFLIEVLVKIAHSIEEQIDEMGPAELRGHENKVLSLTTSPPPLPHFSRFANKYRKDNLTIDGDMRTAHYDSYNPENCEYVMPERLAELVNSGVEVVAAGFVTPYPPGFPVLVPGQVVTNDVVEFMSVLDTREIHGFDPELGYRIFRTNQ
ncbi:MAG: hypothetical protein RLY59_46 [Actinomycetota bacterium]